MSDPSDWFRAVRVMGTTGGPGRFHVTDLSSAIEWNVEYSERSKKFQTESSKYYFQKPVCLNANVEAGDSEWDIHQACRDVLEKETNPPELPELTEKPAEPSTEHYTLVEAAEEWYPCQDDDDRLWELETELAYARRELRRSEQDCRGWRRMALINFASFAIYVAVDIASRFLNN